MRFANRIKNMEDKELLGLMQLSDSKDIISFSGGFPSSETYPIKDIKDSFSKVLELEGEKALSYSSTSGLPALREHICLRMKKNFGVDIKADDVIMTNGSQQAIDISGLLFIDKGDVILFETPSYLGALNALKAYEAQLVAVETDKDGLVIEGLEKAFETYGDRIKLIYVIPDFQNPSGRSWSTSRREEFMEYISKKEVAVLEDAAYSELSFREKKEKPLFAMDPENQVVYCGTFSKIFCPGLRIGYICAKGQLMEKYMILKSNVDLSSSAIMQLEMAYYLDHYDLDKHIEDISELYKSRRDAMVLAIKREFPKEVEFEIPEGGLFLWVTLPENKDTRELLKRALNKNVSFVPGGSFYPASNKNNEMRLNFSNASVQNIDKGIGILGKVINEYLGE